VSKQCHVAQYCQLISDCVLRMCACCMQCPGHHNDIVVVNDLVSFRSPIFGNEINQSC
jgi:hypothetical protein